MIKTADDALASVSIAAQSTLNLEPGIEFRFDQGDEVERGVAEKMANMVINAKFRPVRNRSRFYVSGFFCANGASVETAAES